MKISSPTEVCNLALLRVGQNTISSYDDVADQSIQAQLCKYTYDQSRAVLLSQYQWPFACAEDDLSSVQLSEAEAKKIKYKFKYSLPDGFLRLVCLYSANGREITASPGIRPAYDIQAGYILTDITSCSMKYVFDNKSVSDMSPLFIDALVLDIASRMTKLLNDSSTYLQQLRQEFQIAFTQAKIEDSRQKQMNRVHSFPMLAETGYF